MADSVSGTTGAPRSYEAYVEESRKPKSQLGKSDFLSLLASQLQYQDPMEPMKDSAFVAQLAQFSSLEQLENLNSTMSTFQYFSLAGKYVLCEGTDDSGTEFAVAGVVDRVISKNGETYVQIGDKLVKAKFVTQVYDKDLFTGSNPLLDAAKLIGMQVTGYTTATNEAGEEVVVPVSGIVSRVTIENGEIVAYLKDGARVSVGNILDVREAEPATEPEPSDETDEVTDPENTDPDNPADNTDPENTEENP